MQKIFSKNPRLLWLGPLVLVLLWFLYLVRGVLLLFLLGFILAYILDPLIDRLEQYKIPRIMAIVFIYLMFCGSITLVIIYALPILTREINQLVQFIPGYAADIQKALWDMQDGYSRIPIPEVIRKVIDETIIEVEGQVLKFLQQVINTFIYVFSQTIKIILVPVLGFYFLKEFNSLGPLLLSTLPVKHRSEAVSVGKEINDVIKRFIRGNIIVALLIGIMTTSGLLLIGMDFPFLLGALVGITNFIPYFGAIFAAVPAVLLALLKSKWMAVYVLGLMFLVQQVESNIISPRILGTSVGIHPLVIILALMIGGTLMGLGGLLLAVPLAAVLKILLRHLYMHII